MRTKILVTGATGFIGRCLVDRLVGQGTYEIKLALRSKAKLPIDILDQCTAIEIGNLDGDTHWEVPLKGVDVVVHLAARAHVLNDRAEDPRQAFLETNFYGTRQLAKIASECGVKRFVYISSIGVNGSQTEIEKPFTELDEPQPHNAYAKSKWEAEQALREISEKSGMEFVIVRPPLVYGKDAPGNFAQLLKLVSSGVPIPLGAVQNQRSLVALDNLVDFIEVCCIHPKAANQVFLVSDGEDISTLNLIDGIAQSIGRKVHMVAVPLWLLNIGAAMLGQRAAVQRLCGNLQLDISKTNDVLGWMPKFSVREGLRRATEGWRR